MARSIRWRGNGSLPGIPTKDMTAQQAKQYGGTRWLVATGLYEYIDSREGDDGGQRSEAEESDTEAVDAAEVAKTDHRDTDGADD